MNKELQDIYNKLLKDGNKKVMPFLPLIPSNDPEVNKMYMEALRMEYNNLVMGNISFKYLIIALMILMIILCL